MLSTHTHKLEASFEYRTTQLLWKQVTQISYRSANVWVIETKTSVSLLTIQRSSFIIFFISILILPKNSQRNWMLCEVSLYSQTEGLKLHVKQQCRSKSETCDSLMQVNILLKCTFEVTKYWPFKAGSCSIQVTTNMGLRVYCFVASSKLICSKLCFSFLVLFFHNKWN